MSDQPMTLVQALDVADMASPMPYLARQALAVLRARLEDATNLLNQIRDHAGVSCAVEDLPEAVAAMRRASAAADNTKTLRAFATDVMRPWPEGDLDGFELQEIAVRHGLLALKDPLPTEPCGEHCMCAEYADAREFAEGVQCYVRTAVLTGGAE